MYGRSPVAAFSFTLALVGTATLAASAPSASAQTIGVLKGSWEQAAAMADFPLLRPARTFGLRGRVSVERNGCEAPGKVVVRASFGRPSGKGAQLEVYEAHPRLCGDPGQVSRVRKVRVRGRTVWLYAFCEVVGTQCRVPTGGDRSWMTKLRLRTGTPRVLTAVGLTGSGISARQFLRAARSLRSVTPAASVPLEEFLSSDGSIWCRIGRYDPADRFCVSHGGADEYGAALLLDGTVHLCGGGQADPYAECTQTWNPYALRLRDGLSSDFGGYTCTEQAGAMTCTVKEGSAQGSGFRVSADGHEVLAGSP